MYLLTPVSLLYLLSLFLPLSRFFTLLVVILHDFPYRHETNMTDHMNSGSVTRPDIKNPPRPRGLGGGNRSVQLERLSPGVVNVGVIKPGPYVVSHANRTTTAMLWTLLIALPSLVCALSNTQIPFHIPAHNNMASNGAKDAFRFKEGSDVFTPKDLVELSRPGPGVANVPGDLILVPVSKYSFEDKK